MQSAEQSSFRSDCQPAVFVFLFFLFFSSLLCVSRQIAAKAPFGRFNVISLTETSDLFCMWSVKKCETVCRAAVATRTHTHVLLLLVVLYQAKRLFFLPKGIAVLVCFSLSLILPLNILHFFSCSF